MLQDLYNEICQGHWQDPDPHRCACRGSGWFHSDLDTYHWCPHHGKGIKPPQGSGDKAYTNDYNKNPWVYEALATVGKLRELMRDDNVVDCAEILKAIGMLGHLTDEFKKANEDRADEAYLANCVADRVKPEDGWLVGEWQKRIHQIDEDVRNRGGVAIPDLKVGSRYRLKEDYDEYPQDCHFHFSAGTVVKFVWFADEGVCPCFEATDGYVLSKLPLTILEPFE